MLVLYQYDRLWSEHLDYLQQVRDSIHLVRFGGQTPAGISAAGGPAVFPVLCERIDEVRKKSVAAIAKSELELQELGVRRPSSTWTYVVNDNPFGNKLVTMLLDNANIGFQVDFISAAFL